MRGRIYELAVICSVFKGRLEMKLYSSQNQRSETMIRVGFT